MTERPVPLPQSPAAPSPAAIRDPLSDLLRTVRLRGAVFFMVDAAAPWVSAMPDGPAIAPVLLPDAQQVISFHIVVRGCCFGGLQGGAPLELGPGDVIVFPRGDGYFMSTPRQTGITPNVDRAHAFLRGMVSGALPFVVKDGGGGDDRLILVCGFLGCDARPFNPLMATLPRMVHLKGSARAPDDKLDRLIELTLAESRESTPGTESVRLRLSELMFVEVIRRRVARRPPRRVRRPRPRPLARARRPRLDAGNFG
jgi:hypothetical protein